MLSTLTQANGDGIPRPALLRNAVRLVHCLQKERGVSCAATVSSGTFGEKMKSARHSTSVALKLWSQNNDDNELPIGSTLEKIRRQIDMHLLETREDLSEAGTYHKILVLFNTVIGTVMHTLLLQNRIRSSTVNNKHVKNHDTIKPSHRRFMSLGDAHSDVSSLFSNTQLVTLSNADQELTPSHREVAFKAQPTPETKTNSLLNLLDCFVRLKESTGIERALLSSIFAMRKISNPMLNDLILEVENQFKLIKELQSLKNIDQPLLDVIREGVVLPEPMEQLQSFILREFDLQGFHQQMSTEDVWNLITVHMDKLHSLELHVIEEIECSLAECGVYFDRSDSIQSVDLPGALAEIFDSTANLTEALVQTNPEEIKFKLLSYLAGSDDASTPGALSRPQSPISPNGELPLPLQDSPGTPKEWDIDLYEIKFEKRIGRGTAGTTYLAKWSGQAVAVKVAAITKMGLDGWKTEVESLRKLHHPNVIRLLGCVYNETPLTYCLVLEYCNGGDLATALERPTALNFFNKVAMDMAHGMNYLHKKGVIHRDLKPANVLVDGDVATPRFTAKITDFGVAADIGKSELTSETGTYRWMAPEIVRHESYSEKADVYSYAITVWQLLTREIPFAPYSSIEAAGKVAIELARPPFPNGIPMPILSLITECWAEEPSARLSFSDISKRLEDIKLTDPKEIRWLQASLGHPVYDCDDDTVVMQENLDLPNLQKPPPKIERPTRGLRKLFSKKKLSL